MPPAWTGTMSHSPGCDRVAATSTRSPVRPVCGWRDERGCWGGLEIYDSRSHPHRRLDGQPTRGLEVPELAGPLIRARDAHCRGVRSGAIPRDVSRVPPASRSGSTGGSREDRMAPGCASMASRRAGQMWGSWRDPPQGKREVGVPARGLCVAPAAWSGLFIFWSSRRFLSLSPGSPRDITSVFGQACRDWMGLSRYGCHVGFTSPPVLARGGPTWRLS
jgi:hypothetical protein